MLVIRFGYCPPNPGPNAKLSNKWYTNINDAIDNWNGESIWISSGGKYHKISIEQLYNLKNKL